MRTSIESRDSRLALSFLMLLICAVIVTDSLAAQSGQILLNGKIKRIDLTEDSVVVTNYEGKDFKLIIEDKEIIAKFRDGRIKVGDDVNVKYKVKDGKNIPFSLRKLAGC
ncbi:MAG: hypothetical protein ACLPN1_19320 [Dissulfurispiraceae bacterium]